MTVKDCTNVKESWQLKKEIRGSKKVIRLWDMALNCPDGYARLCGRIQSRRILI